MKKKKDYQLLCILLPSLKRFWKPRIWWICFHTLKILLQVKLIWRPDIPPFDCPDFVFVFVSFNIKVICICQFHNKYQSYKYETTQQGNMLAPPQPSLAQIPQNMFHWCTFNSMISITGHQEIYIVFLEFLRRHNKKLKIQEERKYLFWMQTMVFSPNLVCT